MTCTHDIYKQYDDSYDWWYDGKKIGWKEYSFKVNGSTFVDDGLAQVTFSVSKLSGLDNFKITMNMSSVFGKMTYVYETNFYNKESVLFFEGRRYRGICY